MLPKGEILSNRSYEAKKILCLMGFDYVKVHAYSIIWGVALQGERQWC